MVNELQGRRLRRRAQIVHGLVGAPEEQAEPKKDACTSPRLRSRGLSFGDTFATIDPNDITNLIAGVMASALAGSAWYVSASGYALTVCRLAAVSGGLVATVQPDGTIAENYLGFPVRFSAKTS